MVMLDEPMAGVNPTLGMELLERVQELRASRGMTFLLIEHDLEVVMAVSDRDSRDEQRRRDRFWLTPAEMRREPAT